MADGHLVAEIGLVHEELVLAPTIEAVPDVSIELEYQTIAAPDAYYLFFEVSGEDLDRFDDAVADDPTVSEPTVIVERDGVRVYRVRLTSAERLLLPEAGELGMRILGARSGEGGWIATLETAEMADLQRFRDRCADRGVDVRIRRLYHADEEPGREYGLTAVQRETLRAAYEEGYFDEPRKTDAEDLAKRFDVSTSAISGRLRRGTKALLENTIVR